MLKALAMAMAVMFIAILIPLVHFISGPLSPFLGGFVGSAALRDNPGSAINKGMMLGALMGLCSGGVAALVVGIVTVVGVGASGVLWIIPVGTGIYTWLLGSIGATVGASKV